MIEWLLIPIMLGEQPPTVMVDTFRDVLACQAAKREREAKDQASDHTIFVCVPSGVPSL